jgi:hypothetical protein
MKKFFVAPVVAALIVIAPASGLAAANPSGQGKPSQTCLSASALTEPGHAALAPGSAFNETGPGKAGTVYNPGSQYDVACYQVSQPH